MYSCALIASNNSHYFQVLRVHTKQLYRRSCHLKLDSLICIHCTKTNMPKGKFKLCTLQCCGVCVMWGDKVSPTPHTVGLSLLSAEDFHPSRTPPSPLTPRLRLCPDVPWLLAFLPGPLSNPGEEADGPGFLCTNQGGICSLTDTSPLTHVSSHIHYSSSARWAAVKGRERSGGWAGEGEEDASRGDGRLSCSAPAASSRQHSSVPLVLHTKEEALM